MPKAITPTSSDRHARRHNPLAEDYSPTTPQLKHKTSKKRKHTQQDDDEGARYLDSKASNRILRIGQDLVEEEQGKQAKAQPNPAFTFDSVLAEAHAEDDAGKVYEDDDEAWGDEDEVVEEVEVDPNDQAIFNRFHPSAAQDDPSNLSLDALSSNHDERAQDETAGDTTNLADLILSKIAAHEAATGASPNQPHQASQSHNNDTPADIEDEELPPKVIQVYTQIGALLSRHRTGPLPKPFKILPTLPVHQIPLLLSLTSPESWSPHAHLASVRLFISSKPHIATPYLRDILLPAVRDDIAATKKLNVHLYAALKKALYKPAAFFKGILFPLLEDDGANIEGGPCTLREAHILSSVVARVSVPVLHSAAALLRLCDIAAESFSTSKEDGGGGATNTFIRVLLEKKYALPFKVVDALVFHFARFKALKTAARGRDERNPDADEIMHDANPPSKPQNQQHIRLPVLWHQSLLAFAQRYRNDITEDQREVLLDVVAAVGHKDMGPEVRRELLEGRGRGVPVVEPDGVGGGSGVEGTALHAGEGRGGMEVEAGVGGDDTMVLG